MLHTYHQLISSNYYSYFVLLVKIITCFSVLLLNLIRENVYSNEVNEKTIHDQQVNNDNDEKLTNDDDDDERIINFSNAFAKLAPSMYYFSLLYLYFDFFSTRLLLPVTQFFVVSKFLFNCILNYLILYFFSSSFTVEKINLFI